MSEEAEIAGRSAAAYIRGERGETVNIPLSTDGRVRYTVPQRITEKKDVAVYFRVADVYKNVRLTVKDQDGRTVYQKKKARMAPGEMECITLKEDLLEGISSLSLALEV